MGPKHSAIIAASGGLDSVTLMHYVVKVGEIKDAKAIGFWYGQKHNKELGCARYQADLLDLSFSEAPIPLLKYSGEIAGSSLVDMATRVPDLDSVMGDPQPPTYVPFRNLIFLSCCLSLAEAYGAEEVYYGAQRHDLYGYWDTTVDFLDAVNLVTRLNRKNSIRIVAPFINMSKAEVLRQGLDLGIDYSYTWSCYRGDQLACGVCPTCRERLEAFRKVGARDPLEYERR